MEMHLLERGLIFMRDYLFRGKNKYGEWIYGSLVVAEGKTYIFEDNGWTIVSEISGAIDGVVQYVITESVDQYTGLKDKNGKKIFEGDLLSINGSKVENVICPEVVFNDFQWMCVIRNGERFKYYCHRLEYNPNKYEVIGNIHDNPEMISRKGD